MFPVRPALIALFLTLFALAVVACSQSSPAEDTMDAPSAASQSTTSPSGYAPAASEATRGSTPSPVAAPAQEQPQSLESPASTYALSPPTQEPAPQPDSLSRPSPTAVPAMAMTTEAEVVAEAPAAAMEAAAPVPAAQPSAPSSTSGQQQPASPQVTAGQASVGRQGPAGPPAPQGQASTQSHKPTPMPAPTTSFGQGPSVSQSQPGATTFQDNWRIPAVSTWEDAVSTFSLDTDRTSYRLALNWVNQGYDVEPDSVRAEEWINSFNYGYSHPSRHNEFAIYTDVYRHPLDGRKHMARVAFQAPDLRDDSRPLNVTLVLDASGSMADGNRVEIARAAAHAIRTSLRDQDRIAVVQFTDTVIGRLTVEHSRPDEGHVRRSIDRLQPNGATNVQAGLDLGVELADEARRHRPDAYNYVILMSDGVANVDATNPFAILESAGDYERRNPIRLVTIGVGIANYNDYLLEQLAQHGNGWYRYLDDVHQAQQTFSRENWLNLAVPFADQTRAQVTWNPEFVKSWRIVGYENRVTPDEFFTQDRKEFAEIPSGAATTVFYELELTGQVAQRSASTARLGDIELRWVEPDTGVSREQYATLSGHWRQDFDGVADPYLKLGTIVALAADRYSALPHPGYIDYGSLNWELSELNRGLWALQGDLGHQTAFSDFAYLLDHMTRYVPPEPVRPRDSGYSP